uniref:HGWP repeat containing protein-like n=1 Tax=Oryza sativa subsp. indica TaxID=39946 RepID=C8TFJ1_ORYSI|nr:HGWP repeat containing protein-like [Oryza sativa Indica Group]
MVAGGDHRGAGVPLPSAVPARPPSGAPSRLPGGPGRQPPRPRVRLTRGTHGADRRQPRAPDAAASEDPLFVEVEAGVWESEQGKSHHP